MPTPPAVLCIAGYDPSAGAGVLADVKTCAAFGTYAAAAVTALTVQSTRGVFAVEPLAARWIERQIEALCEDLVFASIKIGMLCDAPSVSVVARALRRSPAIPAVLDPVSAASSGAEFWSAGTREALIAELLPLCELLTPNLSEAASLLGIELAAVEADPRSACAALRALGARAVLLKGGHGSGPEVVDCLDLGGELLRFRGERVPTPNTHGTGCTLSSAIAAELAHGRSLEAAVGTAKRYLESALRGASEWRLGTGCGPLNHGVAVPARQPPSP